MEIEKTYLIQCDLIGIHEILTNLDYYGRLHPLIKSTRKIQIVSKDQQEWIVKERPYPKIPINIEYSVRVKSSTNIVEYEIIGIPFTKVNIKYNLLQTEPKKTDAVFSLKLKGPFISNKILMNKMKAAQNQLIISINQELLAND